MFASVGSHSEPAVCSCTGSPPKPLGGGPGRAHLPCLLQAQLKVSFRTLSFRTPLSSTPKHGGLVTPQDPETVHSPTRPSGRAEGLCVLTAPGEPAPRCAPRLSWPLLQLKPQGRKFGRSCPAGSLPRERQLHCVCRGATVCFMGRAGGLYKTLAAGCITARGQLSTASPPNPPSERQPPQVRGSQHPWWQKKPGPSGDFPDADLRR